jgi:hypothetical protein
MFKLKYVIVFSVIACMLAISVCALAVTNPVPDTGQTQSYTDTFGEDSDYIINPQSYTKLDEHGNELPDSATSWSMVRDNVTGFIWEVKTDDGSIHDKDNKYNWYDAQNVFIATLNAENFGGFFDWRLPTIKELSSIVNSGTYEPAINTDYFPNTMSSNYWSSTTHADNAYNAWRVVFNDGVVCDLDKSSSYYVRAVRGGQPGSFDNLVINGDGTVTDISTGLMWQSAPAGPMVWEAAISYCEGLSLGGHDDWRLPNRNELQSLVDYNRYDVDYNRYDYVYWSSTISADFFNNAWLVSFGYGVGYNVKSLSYYVRAVRGGQSGALDDLIIVAHTPSDHASNIALDTIITVTFKKAMDRTSTEAAFSITPPVSGSITWIDADQTMTFTPSINPSPTQEYTVNIASAAEDTNGHKLDSNENGTGGETEDDYTYIFTTTTKDPTSHETKDSDSGSGCFIHTLIASMQ